MKRIKKIRNVRLLWTLLLLTGLIHACDDAFEQPFNMRVPAEESGLIGLWEGVSIRKDFARILTDERGNNLIDDRGRPIWKDTTLTLTAQNGYSEYIHFMSSGGIDTFIASGTLEGIESNQPAGLPNMPLLQGRWGVMRTINPEKELEDVSSILLYNPVEPHVPNGSMNWTIKSLAQTELTIQYSYGAASYDTLFTKSFRKR